MIKTGKNFYFFDVFISNSNFSKIPFYEEKKMLIHSDRIESITQKAEKLGLVVDQAQRVKKDIYNVISTDIKTKMEMAIVLIIILAFNLRSSFINALSERKYEVSVRRALGASQEDIIKQFVGEGMIVMMINIALTIMIALVILGGVQIYNYFVYDLKWTIIIKPYSMIIFLASSLLTSLAISLDYGINTSKVEIIKYIKGV